MPSLFIVFRASLYGVVFVATLICLSMAAHFQSVLATSDLTRFVPFALFVCVVGLLVISTLLGCALFFRDRSPISTRLELASLGFIGILWLALGVFLSTSDSQSADVECFADSSTQALDVSASDLQTERYHAMYHVLMAFSLINMILLLLAFAALLFFAVRRHLNGDYHMWYGPVTAGMVKDYSRSKPTSRRGPSKTSILPSILPTVMTEKFTEKPSKRGASKHRPTNSASRRAQRSTPIADRHSRRGRRPSGSGQSSLIGANEYDSGGMNNPNRDRVTP